MSHLTSATIDSEDNVRSTVHENFQEDVLRGLTLFQLRGVIFTLCFCTHYCMRYCTRYCMRYCTRYHMCYRTRYHTHTLVRHPSRRSII